MPRLVMILAVVALTIYCLVEIVQARDAEVRSLPRWLWFALMFVPILGPIGWLLAGRPQPAPAVAPPQARHTRRITPPDDDEDFLRRLR